MSRLLRPRIPTSYISRSGARPSSSSTVPPAAGKSPSAAATAATSSASSGSSASQEPSGAELKKSRGFLKFGVVAALACASGAAGYATYAYTSDELVQSAEILRSLARESVNDDATALEKFRSSLYSTTMKVPVKAIEIYTDIRKSIENQIQGFTEPSSDKLLPDLHPQEQHVFTLVLDLNETLVYSDWTRDRGWRTFKRAGAEAFLEQMAQFYEIVVYSDQLSMYVDPVIERLDQKGCIRYRLSRAATRYTNGKHYRDLSKLNRDPSRVLYVSGHALDSCLQPENAVPLKPWKGEVHDTALLDLIPFLEYVARNRPADIRPVLGSYEGHDIASEFIERSKAYERRMEEQKKGRLWRR